MSCLIASSSWQCFLFQALAHDPADLQACARIYARDRYPEVPSARMIRPRRGAAYEKMWQAWLAGEKPKGFSVP